MDYYMAMLIDTAPQTRFPISDLASLKHAYETEGYCIAANLFSAGEVAEIRDFFQNRSNLPEKDTSKHSFYDAGKDTGDPNDPLKQWPRYVHPHRDLEVARRYLLHPGAARVLTALLESEPLAVQSMYYYKPPGARGQGLHQDNMYLRAEPGTCIAAWTAIDACDFENGSIRVVPGSHIMSDICDQHDADTGSFTGTSLKVPKGMEAIPTVMEAGDTLFFNGQIIHGSAPNRSKDRWRRSFICHYVSDNTEKLAQFYHPILDMRGNVVSREVNAGGGPCGGDAKKIGPVQDENRSS